MSYAGGKPANGNHIVRMAKSHPFSPADGWSNSFLEQVRKIRGASVTTNNYRASCAQTSGYSAPIRGFNDIHTLIMDQTVQLALYIPTIQKPAHLRNRGVTEEFYRDPLILKLYIVPRSYDGHLVP